MRRISVPVLAFALVSFIAIQTGGAHLHAEMPGQNEHAETHEPHLQQTYFDHEDHDGVHVDVDVLDTATATFKIDVALPSAEFSGSSLPDTFTSLHALPRTTLQLRDRSRWRPPLRAPPLQTS